MNDIIKLENGVMTIDEKFVALISQVQENLEKAQEDDKVLRETLLSAMIDMNVSTIKAGGYTISQVIPKSTVTFNVEQFVADQTDEVVNAFIESQVTEAFDLESFKAKHPDIYEQFVKKDEKFSVNLKKLQKSMPAVYEKYTTEVKSDKPITLKIAKSK